MQINQFPEVMSSCRFCFMCRHLSAVGQVSGRESDTPRGRALIADRVRMHPEEIGNADFIEAVYRSDLSGANRFHCDSYHDGKGYDEIGLQLALRRDIVDAGVAPENVKQVAADLKATESWTVEGSGDVLYFVDPGTAARPSVEKAVKAVLDKANVSYAVVRGGCIGKALNVLGFAADAKAAMEKFAAVVNGTGAKVLLVSNPAAADALKCDFAAAGVTLVPEVKFTAGYFVKLAEEGRLSFAGKTGVASYLPSDYLKNYLKCGCAKKLLALLGVQDRMFGTNVEESYTAGEGALVLDRLYPELVKMLAGKIAAQAEPDVPVIVASAYTAGALEAAGLKCTTLEEAAEADLCSLR